MAQQQQQRIGKYIVERELGAGNFGNVYQAFDPDLQKHIAIKKLKSRKAQDGEMQVDTRLQFAREAQNVAKLSHPNIVTVHGFGTDEADGAPYLVMEMLEGETLEQFIRKRSAAPLVQKIEIMHQMAEGLQFAHTRNVIHRDIKPANIMVLPDGTAKVMDFAVAPEGFSIGTPPYMAPEQFTGHGSDILTDIFGYGAVYYELLTGQRPYDHKVQERSQTSRYEPPRVGVKVKDCPPWLDLLIARLIAKRRDQRMESLEEMLVETRPTLQKLKQERAAELAAEIGPATKKDQEKANRLIAQVLRLDPLNREARAWRGINQSGQRDVAKARAKELVQQGEAEFAAGTFAKAQKTFEEALVLDIGNPAIERLLDKARGKAEEARSAQLLVDEVVDDVIAAGPVGMPTWQIENAFNKLTRAVHLDERNPDAIELRAVMLPVYEQIFDQAMAPAASAPTGEWAEMYDKRVKEAQRARKNREFDHAKEILRKLLPQAPDDRAQREMNAVVEDQESNDAAQDASRHAVELKKRGKLDEALKVLDQFAGKYPRRAKAVEEERRALKKQLEMIAAKEEAARIAARASESG